MIHSLAGGKLRDSQIFDLAKVKILKDEKILFYICDNPLAKAGDITFVPYGKLNEPTQAQILRIDKNVESKNFPINFSSLKHFF